MIITLEIVASWDILGLEESYQGICFKHAFSNACQYAIMDEFFCKDLTYVCIKIAQGYLQKCITWTKRFGKGRQ